MLKLFGFGVFLGVAAAGVAAWYLPAADLTRETSIVSVLPNGGNAEVFRVHVPDDRIIAGANAASPPGLEWPDELAAAGTELEVFKLRNRDDVVIGVASRVAAGGTVEWLLHLPARGTLYFPLTAGTGPDGARSGTLRAGTREFEQRSGHLRERYTAAGSDGGMIELQAILVGLESEDAGGAR